MIKGVTTPPVLRCQSWAQERPVVAGGVGEMPELRFSIDSFLDASVNLGMPVFLISYSLYILINNRFKFIISKNIFAQIMVGISVYIIFNFLSYVVYIFVFSYFGETYEKREFIGYIISNISMILWYISIILVAIAAINDWYIRMLKRKRRRMDC